jgi:3-methylfumaryl-CoA hydratase
MRQVVAEEVVAPGPGEALAGLLDVEVPDDDEVPELWHWVHLLEHPATRDLGPDGHPTSGIPAPPGPGMRRMFAGGRVESHRRLRIGEPATRTTSIVAEVEKTGRTGPLRFLTIRHEIRQGGELAVVGAPAIAYRPPAGRLTPTPGEGLPDRTPSLALEVDERLLFRFSALTYNAHRIHYDRGWCRQEGYDALVVHGPLQALMMGELARRNGVPLLGRRFGYRLVAPMLGPQTMHVLASTDGLDAGAEVHAGDGRRCALSELGPLC